jgi:hypothetical protein
LTTTGVLCTAALAWGGATFADVPNGGITAELRTADSAPAGLTLDKDQQTITSALRVDLTRDFATLPLHKGTANGETVWYVITDTSDAGMASQLGINHAPKLRNASRDCPACVQEVKTSDPVLGVAEVQFQGAPDFSLDRTLTPAAKPTTFPPKSFTVGAMAGAGYSPYVRVKGHGDVVFNAPIVATGDGPFDVTTHTNTHDRTLGIDTEKLTTDHLFVRGFANGRPIAYLSFDSSDAFTATVERSTFVPALADLQFQNGGDGPARDDRADSARASIFTFVNAMVGLEDSPPRSGATDGPGRSQGLTHALSFPIVGRDAAVANPAVLDGLRRGGDVSNIFSDMPANVGNSNPLEYSPAWDLQVGVYSDAAVAARRNGLQTDAETVLALAAQGEVTAPGGLPLGSANIIINCPALAFLDDAPIDPISGADAGGGGTAKSPAGVASAPLAAGVPAQRPGGDWWPLNPGTGGALGVGLALLGFVLVRRGRTDSESKN